MRIFHPTDLHHGSSTAFLHALRLAVDTRSRLTIMHVASDAEAGGWSELPGVRSTLARWGMVKDAADMEGLERLGVGVRKVVVEGRDPARACVEHLEEHPADLVVLATHQAEGLLRWVKRQVAIPLARAAGAPALFVPYGRSGFLDRATGRWKLRRMLVPMAMDPHPRAALEMIVQLVSALQLTDGIITLLHVGDAATTPHVEVPGIPGWKVERITRAGDVVGTITHVAEATGADLLVMTTKGREGFLDVLRGTDTEKVVRAVACPVLAVPAQGRPISA